MVLLFVQFVLGFPATDWCPIQGLLYLLPDDLWRYVATRGKPYRQLKDEQDKWLEWAAQSAPLDGCKWEYKLGLQIQQYFMTLQMYFSTNSQILRQAHSSKYRKIKDD